MRRACLLVTLLGLAVAAPPARADAVHPDVMRFADAAAAADRDLGATVSTVRRRLLQVSREYVQCPVVDDLRGRRLATAYAAMSLRFVHAVFDAPRRALSRFAARVGQPPAADLTLRRGARAWRDVIAASLALPRGPVHICRALTRWRRSGFAASAAPISPRDRARQDAYIALRTRAIGRIDDAAARLRRLGASAAAAERFSYRHLVLAAQGEEG